MHYRVTGSEGARDVLVVLERGDALPDSLVTLATELRIAAAAVSGIGALEAATLGFFEPTERRYVEIPVDEQVEVLTFLGNLTEGPGGEARLHAHVTLGRRDGSTIGGHLIAARVRPTLELFLSETGGRVVRAIDEDCGLPLIAL